MSFWDQHAKAKAPRKAAAPSAQNAPARCSCGHVGTDVLFGSCAACDEAD